MVMTSSFLSTSFDGTLTRDRLSKEFSDFLEIRSFHSDGRSPWCEAADYSLSIDEGRIHESEKAAAEFLESDARADRGQPVAVRYASSPSRLEAELLSSIRDYKYQIASSEVSIGDTAARLEVLLEANLKDEDSDHGYEFEAYVPKGSDESTYLCRCPNCASLLSLFHMNELTGHCPICREKSFLSGEFMEVLSDHIDALGVLQVAKNSMAFTEAKLAGTGYQEGRTKWMIGAWVRDRNDHRWG